MQLIFENNVSYDLILNNSLVAETYKKIYKKLQHATLNFKDWDNPYYKVNKTKIYHVEKLINFADKLKINVDIQKILDQNQDYLNYLHKIYENNSDGNPDWLDYHEHIHLCEENNNTLKKILVINYREKAGLVTKKVEKNILNNLQTTVKKGQIFTRWAELGKKPYNYFIDKEPNDIYRMRELIKPWTYLYPIICIALDDCNFVEGKNIKEFTLWWEKYSPDWCEHNKLEKYDITDMFGVSIIGFTEDTDKITYLLQQNILPNKIKL